MSTSVLIVERPGQFRDGLLREVTAQGAEAHVRDDGMEALASLERLKPNIVLVSDDPGPPGALSLCRLMRRKLRDASVYRLGEPSLADIIDERSMLLPRAVGAPAIASALLNRATTWTTHRAWSAPLGSLELGPLLIAIGTRWLTGRLLLTRPGTEREISFVRGVPVHARSSVLSERVGAIGIRRGLFNETQLEQALDLAHSRGLRLGEALLELGALDAPRLFGVLSAQLVEQLAAACNAGASQARFMLDQTEALRGSLLRLSPMTGLLHAVQQTPIEDVERVLDELAERTLVGQVLPRVVEQWLSDLQLPGAAQLAQAGSVRALRTSVREGLPANDVPLRVSPDSVTLTLLRSGAFSMTGRTSMVPNDLRAGIRTLSPPSIASAVVRCAHSSFEDWGVSAFAQARTPLEQGIDEYLHGKRPPLAARAAALLGPEADFDEAHAEVYALYLRTGGGPRPFIGFPAAVGGTLVDLRTRCHELQKRLDALEAEHTAPIARAQIVQTRAHRAGAGHAAQLARSTRAGQWAADHGRARSAPRVESAAAAAPEGPTGDRAPRTAAAGRGADRTGVARRGRTAGAARQLARTARADRGPLRRFAPAAAGRRAALRHRVERSAAGRRRTSRQTSCASRDAGHSRGQPIVGRPGAERARRGDRQARVAPTATRLESKTAGAGFCAVGDRGAAHGGACRPAAASQSLGLAR